LKYKILLLLLILVFTTITFYNLGDTYAPQSPWIATDEGVIIDFGEVRFISRFQYMNGSVHDISFNLDGSGDGIHRSFIINVELDVTSVFKWSETLLHASAQYVHLWAERPGLRLQEIAFRDENDELIVPVSVTGMGASNLFDEQHLVPERASFRNSFYFDEIYHARAGYEFLHGLRVLEDTHPPMGKNFIALSVSQLGMTPFGWRLPGTLAGILMIPLMYAFAKMMFNSERWAFFTALIFAFDFMLFAQTRIATIDSYLVLFVIAMYLCMYAYVRNCDDFNKMPLWKSMLWLGLSGICMGMAISVKWQGVYAAAGLAILFFPALFRVYARESFRAMITVGACLIFFVAIPVGIYLFSYILFVPAMDTTGEGYIATVMANQHRMFNYHVDLIAEHPFASRWWEWPLIVTPMFYYVNVISDTTRQGISSFGNPALWWTGIPATFYAIYVLALEKFSKPNKSSKTHKSNITKNKTNKSNKANNKVHAIDIIDKQDIADESNKKDTRSEEDKAVCRLNLMFLLTAYAAQFLPWVIVSRLTFIYHYFPSVPFVTLLIALCFKEYIAPKYPRLMWGYAALVFGLFVLFYPVLSAAPVSVWFAHNVLRWFPGWILV